MVPIGAAPKAQPPLVLSRVPFVCGVNVGGLLCGTSIESIESIKSLESIESAESSESIESIQGVQIGYLQISEISFFQNFGFPVRQSEPLLNQHLVYIRRERKQLRRFH